MCRSETNPQLSFKVCFESLLNSMVLIKSVMLFSAFCTCAGFLETTDNAFSQQPCFLLRVGSMHLLSFQILDTGYLHDNMKKDYVLYTALI